MFRIKSVHSNENSAPLCTLHRPDCVMLTRNHSLHVIQKLLQEMERTIASTKVRIQESTESIQREFEGRLNDILRENRDQSAREVSYNMPCLLFFISLLPFHVRVPDCGRASVLTDSIIHPCAHHLRRPVDSAFLYYTSMYIYTYSMSICIYCTYPYDMI